MKKNIMNALFFFVVLPINALIGAFWINIIQDCVFPDSGDIILMKTSDFQFSLHGPLLVPKVYIDSLDIMRDYKIKQAEKFEKNKKDFKKRDANREYVLGSNEVSVAETTPWFKGDNVEVGWKVKVTSGHSNGYSYDNQAAGFYFSSIDRRDEVWHPQF